MKKLSILIPFLNEEKYIWELLFKIIKLDLDSIWYKKEVFLIINNKNINWKWYSIKEGIIKVTWVVIIIQDADLEYDPEDYYRMIEKLEKDNLDFIYWSRNRWLFEKWFKYSYLTFFFWWLLLSFLTSILVFKLVTDEPTCYKMFRSNLKKYLLIPDENWFEWEPAITMLLFRKWFKYWEVPINYFPRKLSEWKKICWVDWVRAVWVLVKWRIVRVR